MMDPTDIGRLEQDGGYEDAYETAIGDRTPSEAVVDAVAAIADVEPASLVPLYDTVDPDALDAFATSGHRDGSPTVSFDYQGFTITVEGSERVVVVEP